MRCARFAYQGIESDDSRLHIGELTARTTWLKANTLYSERTLALLPVPEAFISEDAVRLVDDSVEGVRVYAISSQREPI